MSKKGYEFEGLHAEMLEQWLENGNEDILPDEIREYIDQLDLVRGWYYTLKTPPQIIKLLCQKYDKLSPRTARSRYNDALNHFYLSNSVKKEAWANIYADELDRLKGATIRAAKTPQDFKIAKEMIMSAAKVRGVFNPDEKTLPKELFDRPIKIYTMNPEELGLPKADRNVLAEQIENLQLPEAEKSKLRQDAGVEPKTIFDYEQEEEN